MPTKIYWCKEAGTVYWLENGAVMFAPMNNDDTANLDDGGEAEVWEEGRVTEAEVRAKLV